MERDWPVVVEGSRGEPRRAKRNERDERICRVGGRRRWSSSSSSSSPAASSRPKGRQQTTKQNQIGRPLCDEPTRAYWTRAAEQASGCYLCFTCPAPIVTPTGTPTSPIGSHPEDQAVLLGAQMNMQKWPRAEFVACPSAGCSSAGCSSGGRWSGGSQFAVSQPSSQASCVKFKSNFDERNRRCLLSCVSRRRLSSLAGSIRRTSLQSVVLDVRLAGLVTTATPTNRVTNNHRRVQMTSSTTKAAQ